MISDILRLVKQVFQVNYYGFIKGHNYLNLGDIQNIKSLIGAVDPVMVHSYESHFARLIGSGSAVSFAAARMGFYQLMQVLNIGRGDEVILLGATCSVMATAIMRTGATPIFSDIDPNTFGSSKSAIEPCISAKTRMIVAQHSFGIPCDIEPIALLAKERGIFLLEDCALTLGSKIRGITVGNFGDAALFSTDHSKPINTLIGGLVYTNNTKLANQLRDSQKKCPELSVKRQKALWRRIMLEAVFCTPRHYSRYRLIDRLLSIWGRLTSSEGDFLVDDFFSATNVAYPYPAKLPAFLAAIGMLEIGRWQITSRNRQKFLISLIQALSGTSSIGNLPSAYKNKNLEIIPLRFAWHENNGVDIRRILGHFIDVSWTWFMDPIVGARGSLRLHGYHAGSCPISEAIGMNMINIPCIYNDPNLCKIINSQLL